MGLGTAAESGWDFSSRWFNGTNITSVRAHEVVPVDLNSFLYKNEIIVADFARRLNDHQTAA
jgi:alpha,alpha-trehalase